mgnify:CR=1 FL=1
MGLGDMMYKLGIRYGSEEGQEFAAQIMEFVRFHSMAKSIELAKERGTFQAFAGSIYDDKQPYPEGPHMQWQTPKPLVPFTRDWTRPTLDWAEITVHNEGNPLSPADQATRVARVRSVVVEFNEAIHPATVIDAIQILKPDDQVVPAALTLNLANRIATLSPATELAANTLYRVRLRATIADPTGLPLEGPNEFTFRTVPLSTRDPAAQLIIYEPVSYTHLTLPTNREV